MLFLSFRTRERVVLLLQIKNVSFQPKTYICVCFFSRLVWFAPITVETPLASKQTVIGGEEDGDKGC